MSANQMLLVLVALAALFGATGCGKGRTSRMPEFASHPKPTHEQIVEARVHLRESEPTPQPLIPFPVPIAREWGVRQTATDSLARIGLPALPALIAALKDPQADVRDRAAQALARMGPPAQEAVPALVAALNDTDWRVRRSAARALGQIGPGAEAAVPALIEVIRNPEADRGAPKDAALAPT